MSEWGVWACRVCAISHKGWFSLGAWLMAWEVWGEIKVTGRSAPLMSPVLGCAQPSSFTSLCRTPRHLDPVRLSAGEERMTAVQRLLPIAASGRTHTVRHKPAAGRTTMATQRSAM